MSGQLIRRRWTAVVVMVLAAALVATGCGGSDSDGGSGGTGTAADGPSGVLRIGAGSFVTFDPTSTKVGLEDTVFSRPVYDTLIDATDSTNLKPSLATSWEVSADGLTVTMKLRTDVTFPDGSSFDSAVAKANIDRRAQVQIDQAREPDTTNVETPDASTVVITLPQQSVGYLAELGSRAGYMISAAGMEDPELDQTPAGSGPYLLDTGASSVAEKVYTPRDGYWNPDAQLVERIEISSFADPSATLNAIRAGEVDVVVLDAANASQAEDAGLAVATKPQQYFAFNIQDRKGEIVPALAEQEVRQALSYAIDRSAFVDTLLSGYGEPSAQPYVAGQLGYAESLEGTYEYDVDKAKELLADAGYPEGFDFTIASNAAFQTAHTAIQGFLDEIGVTMNIELLDDASFGSNVTSGKYPVFISRFPASESYTIAGIFFGPNGPLNPQKNADTEIQTLVDQAEKISDPAERAGVDAQITEKMVNGGALFAIATADAISVYDADAVDNVVWTEDPFPNILTMRVVGS